MIRRQARPLLGTLPKVRASRASAIAFEVAADAAFGALAHVRGLLRFQDAGNDLRRIARAHAGERLGLHPRTVPCCAAFDAKCASRAVAECLLPSPVARRPSPVNGTPPGDAPSE